jgi:hypothetical protein
MQHSAGGEERDKDGDRLSEGREIIRSGERLIRERLLQHLATCNKCWHKARTLSIRGLVRLAISGDGDARIHFSCGDQDRLG